MQDDEMKGPDIQPDHRIDAVLLTEVKLSNPNGDPDLEGRPRELRSTGQGLITGVATKRRIRDTARIRHGVNLFVENEALEDRVEGLFDGEDDAPTTETIDERAWSEFWDVRMFGGTLSAVKIGDGDGVRGSQITGPWQVGMGKSLDPINIVDVGITRSVQNTEGDQGTMGRQPVVEYGLYRQHMHYSPYASYGDVEKTDLDVMWDALAWMHDHTRASMRPDVSWRGIYLIEHDNELGSMPAHRATDLIEVEGEPEDYTVTLPDEKPDGVTIHTLVHDG
jgi:CRISPR-associated protein Cas7/Csd2 subtype I-C